MSVSGVSSNNFLNYSSQNIQNPMQQFQQEFQQLGTDLQSGNLSAAQSDFATLQQLSPQSSSQGNSAIAQQFSQLSQDLQSGNLSAAQQDFSTLQQDFQNHAARGHHHHHGGENGGESNTVSQEMSQLGQELQSGNLSGAQQAYNTMLQQFQQYSVGTSSQQSTTSGTVSLSA